MGQWLKAPFPEAPVYPVDLKSGDYPNSMDGLERMSPVQIQAMRMLGSSSTQDKRVYWFLEVTIAHHGGALEMA